MISTATLVYIILVVYLNDIHCEIVVHVPVVYVDDIHCDIGVHVLVVYLDDNILVYKYFICCLQVTFAIFFFLL